MDFQKIIENGYGELAQKLSDYDKGILKGYEMAINSLGDFKSNLGEYIETDVPTIAKIEKEISEITTDNAIEWLKEEHDEVLVSLVDNDDNIQIEGE